MRRSTYDTSDFIEYGYPITNIRGDNILLDGLKPGIRAKITSDVGKLTYDFTIGEQPFVQIVVQEVKGTLSNRGWTSIINKPPTASPHAASLVSSVPFGAISEIFWHDPDRYPPLPRKPGEVATATPLNPAIKTGAESSSSIKVTSSAEWKNRSYYRSRNSNMTLQVSPGIDVTVVVAILLLATLHTHKK